MPTQEEMLQQTYTGQAGNPFEWFSKPWKKRYAGDVFPSLGLDMGNIPFGGALTGGESSFYPGQGQSQGGETNILALLAKVLPQLAGEGMKQILPTQGVSPLSFSESSLPQNTIIGSMGRENTGLEPPLGGTNLQYLSGLGTTGLEPPIGGTNLQYLYGLGGNQGLGNSQAVFNVDEGMANLPSGVGGGSGLLNQNLGSLGSTLGGMIPQLFGYNNPALNQIGGTLGGLGGAALSGTGIFNPINQGAETLGSLTNAGGMPGLSLLTNPASGQSDFTNPYSGYVSMIPLIGQVLGGFLEGILGSKTPETSYPMYNQSTGSFVPGLVYGDISGGQDFDIIGPQMQQIMSTIADRMGTDFTSEMMQNPSQYLSYMTPSEASFYQNTYAPSFETTSPTSFGGNMTPYDAWVLQGGHGAVGV